mgnify:CR=1 FL=1
MSQTTHQFDFLIEYVLALLEENKIELSEEQKKIYVPQILAQVEMRLGAKLLPKLDGKQTDRFVKLSNNEGASPEEWKAFWHESVPTFEEDVKNILTEFAEKTKQLLASK